MPKKNNEKSYIVKIHKATEQLTILDNEDKEFQSVWKEGDSLGNFPHSWRMYLSAPPSSGKTCIIQNLVILQDPPFERIVVVHCAPDLTSEYKDIVTEEDPLRSTIPELDEWDGTTKSLLILDDVDTSSQGMSKAQRALLAMTLRFSSSHNNLSVIITNQQYTGLSVRYRRLMNIFMVGIDGNDLDSLAILARKACGRVPRAVFLEIMESFTDIHDFLLVDGTPNSPAKLRKGLFQKIEINEDFENELIESFKD